MTAINNIREKRRLAKERRFQEKSKYVFQVQEWDGQLWLTCHGMAVLPCEMLKEDPLSVLRTIRELWVKRMMEVNLWT